MIDYSEFLTHALGWKQLSKINVACFFKTMVPRSANKDFNDTQQDNISSDSDESSDSKEPSAEFLNASIIHEYFTMCGKVMLLENIQQLMDEVETLFKIKGFNGKPETQIDFETFYRFMTSFLVQEEDQNAKLATVEYSVDEEKKSESKSNESTNQSRRPQSESNDKVRSR